ncbi:putative threonine--tRNA ligase [Helianthus annuus]|nr:putative threonine--tRNA ligase [Helianthus annuus]
MLRFSPGSCFFLHHGTRITEKLMAFIRTEYRKRGYLEVTTPNMYNMQLWETSGHAANYKENMFVFDIKEEVKSVLEFINYAYDVFGFTFALKLPTC